MSITQAGMAGQAPSVVVKPVVDHEQAKYEKMWAIDGYRNYSPGEQVAQVFLQQARLKPDDVVIDFGTGTGRGALMLALFGRVKVKMLDFADNCLDEDVRNALVTQPERLSFEKADLRNPIPVTAKHGFCTDVMEHIETDKVDQTLRNIMKSAQHVFFQISLVDDAFGALIGEPLHLTVKPYQWWLNKFKELDAVVLWSKDVGDAAMFYVSAWNDVSELVKNGTINVEMEALNSNIRANLSRNVACAKPYDRQEKPVMILAGGPSLLQFEDEIIKKRMDGQVLVTVNGAYNWAVARGLNPSAQIVVDARDWNKRFVEPTVPGCRYLLSSQCHPEVFDAVPEDQTVMWHGAIDGDMEEELNAHYAATGEAWYPSVGGSTVMLRALPLLRMLGFYKFEIYGFDSCLLAGEHHAYTQSENVRDSDLRYTVKVSCGDKIFTCTPWHASQAQEFIDLIRLLGDEIELDIKGDGLIANIIKTAAEFGKNDTLVTVDTLDES